VTALSAERKRQPEPSNKIKIAILAEVCQFVTFDLASLSLKLAAPNQLS
jgi:hypothetical protein